MPADAAAALDRFLRGWVESGEVTAAYAAIATPRETLWSGAGGADGEPQPSSRSLFDAASLTKPWMASLALRLDAARTLSLQTRVRDVWPEADAPLGRRTLGDLLRHRAGLLPWAPLYGRCRSSEAAAALLVSGALSARPAGGGCGPRAGRTNAPARPGSEGAYSDLDYILWGFAAERVLDAPLTRLLCRELLDPCGIDGVEVAPGQRADVVVCRCDDAREVELAAKQGVRLARRGAPERGQPQDGNARFLGGIAGHSGLFVTADAMVALGRGWLGALRGEGDVIEPAAARAALAGSGAYTLGWARRRVAGSAGPTLGVGAFGHVGFTGGSLWVDPERSAIFLLLAHRADAGGSLNPARRRYHALAAALVGGHEGSRGRSLRPRSVRR